MTDSTSTPSERELLMQRADILGIEYPKNVSTLKLSELVSQALTQDIEAMTAQEMKDKIYGEARADSRKLVRIRLSCMNPNKKDWPGEIIGISNDAIGTVKKYIPFNATDGWHIPLCMLAALQERQYQVFYKTRTPNGQTITRTKLANEFSIELLPNLTAEELLKVRNYAKATIADQDEEG
jgi:hypothetical protein